jgi:FtsP/CotA-like multicopper oxidase with cupredoxin domain
MRRAFVGMLALALACYAVPAAGQQPAATGAVKTATDKGLVVVGHEEGQQDREWAFAFDGSTRIDADGKPRPATELREGDAVTVSYTNRDGKIIAQNVKVNAR